MVKFRNIKTGFSLVEVLVSMLLMSIFFLATTKVITVKQTGDKVEVAHGYYECYYSSGWYEHRLEGASEKAPKSVSTCTFFPPKGTPMVQVYVVSGGSIYKTLQTVFNDEGVAISVSQMKDIISNMDEDTVNSSQSDFASYLEHTNTSSEVYKYYKSSGSFPNAVYISW